MRVGPCKCRDAKIVPIDKYRQLFINDLKVGCSACQVEEMAFKDFLSKEHVSKCSELQEIECPLKCGGILSRSIPPEKMVLHLQTCSKFKFRREYIQSC
mmetsp:Transcript_13607/g.21291  ORF Transcript_13607/g.21291 Transcript_13607/m.21291 type:complete len:99 (+) Transcript_13607:246-542(+)